MLFLLHGCKVGSKWLGPTGHPCAQMKVASTGTFVLKPKKIAAQASLIFLIFLNSGVATARTGQTMSDQQFEKEKKRKDRKKKRKERENDVKQIRIEDFYKIKIKSWNFLLNK